MESPELLKKSKRAWYKQPWLITLVILLVLWFGLPSLIDLFSPATNTPAATKINLPLSNISRQRLETADDPVKGSEVAPIVIVEFSDFECPFCQESVPIIKRVLKEYPEAVKLIYRDFPVSAIHPQAVAAAEAANCASKQGAFWSYHDALFGQQESFGEDLYLAIAKSLRLDEEVFKNCLTKHLTLTEIQNDVTDGLAAGITGTPTWFVNGRKVDGALTFETWQLIIDSVIREEFAGN